VTGNVNLTLTTESTPGKILRRHVSVLKRSCLLRRAGVW